MNSDQATVGAFLVACLVAAGSATAYVWPRVRRFFRTVNGGLLELTGTPAEHDRAGREVKPAVPSLSAQIGDIRTAIRDQGKQNERLTALETTQAAHARLLAEHGRRLTELHTGHQAERVAGHIASAAAFSAIEEAAKRGHAAEGSLDVDVDDPGA